ncbi:MAG: Crp/Fnr family transcriptional regulator [Burkholderiaceae bacterium]
MISIRNESAWKGTSNCMQCPLRGMDLFADFTHEDFAHIHAPIDEYQYGAGQLLYAEGAEAAGIYTVRSGLVKLMRVTTDGRERVTRIVRPGDIAGLEALATGRYDSDAMALTDTALCRIPLEVVHRLAHSSPRLYGRLMQKWQQALKSTDDWLTDVSFGPARQRVRQFMLKMRNEVDSTVTILFSREEMGAMMDLKHETVSREVSLLVKEGVLLPLDKRGRSYKLVESQLNA